MPTLRQIRKGSVRQEDNFPTVHKMQRTTSGVHNNPYRVPKSACNAVSFSLDVLPQVLAGMVFYTTGHLQEEQDD